MMMSDVTLPPPQFLTEIVVLVQACEHLISILWLSFGIFPCI